MVPTPYTIMPQYSYLETEIVNGESDSVFEDLIVQIFGGFPGDLSSFSFGLSNPTSI